tara:strand:- start:407 stop:1537 length:1131 start_codon:yes stop_codon:yes gene_type:complete
VSFVGRSEQKMRLLKRYVLKKFIQVYFLTLTALIGMFLVVDFFERVDEFLMKGGTIWDMFAYYIYKIPFIFFFMGPQAVLLATVITLVSFSRNNEFTAMKACGIGVTGITFPIVITSAGIAIMVLVSNEYIAPMANNKMYYIFNVKVRGHAPPGTHQLDRLWLRGDNGWIWNIGYYDSGPSMMKKVSLFSLDENQSMIRRIDASAAIWNGKEWEFLNGFERGFSKDGIIETEYFDKKAFPVAERPSDFNKVKKRPEEMSIRDLYAEIQDTISGGGDPTKKWVDLHHKISYPFISVVLALIGIPLSIRSSRTGGLLFCVGLSLVLGFLFSFVYAISISLGHGGTFDPVMAAWGPNILFASIGFYLVMTLDSTRVFPV